MKQDAVLVVGGRDFGLPPMLIRMLYPAGSYAYTGPTECGHRIMLSPEGHRFLAEHEEAKAICSDCVESYSILHNEEGEENQVAMLPGAEESLKEHYGEEMTEKILQEARPELERRIGGKFVTGESDDTAGDPPTD
jgi:hypothetical protein